MTLELHLHPFASFCQKAIMAFYEKQVPFRPVIVDLGDPQSAADFKALWPMAKMPVLRDPATGTVVPESTIVIEYLEQRFPTFGPRLIPDDADIAREVRLWDRVLDNYVHQPMQAIVADHLRPENARDPFGVEKAREQLQAGYRLIDNRMAGRDWIAADMLTMADCAAAPALYYGHQVVPIDPRMRHLAAYYDRLMTRPSYRHVLEEARPFFDYFPIGRPARMPVQLAVS